MQLSAPTALLALLVAAAFTLLFTRWVERSLAPQLRNGLLALLALAALVAHLDVLRWRSGEGLVLQPPVPQVHDLFHYYLGSKYFAELGYGGLYEAAVLADAEDDAEHVRPAALIRNLRTGRLDTSRGDVVGQRAAILARFTEARWQGFKHDVSVFRSWIRSDYWHTTGFVVDHGYNAPPLVTLLLGALSNGGLVAAEDFAGWLRWLDIYLILLLGIFLTASEGTPTGLAFLVFAFANPLHDYGFVGGAFLRTDYLLPLVLAVLSLRRGWRLACGGLLAVSGLLRIFPLLLVVVIGLRDLLPRDRARRLRARLPLYASFAVTSAVLLLASSWLSSPEGRNPWVEFAENLRTHAASQAANRIGLASLVVWERDPTATSNLEAASRKMAEWDERSQRRSQERSALRWIASGTLVAAALAAAWRLPRELLPLSWMLLVYALQPLAHYYWAMLAIVPVLAGDRHRWLHLLGGATLVVLSLTAAPLLAAGEGELRFTLYATEVLGFLLIACVAGVCAARPRGATQASVQCD